jgi:ribosome biogenesis GTPase A
MSQNQISLTLTDQQLSAIDDALTTLERQLIKLISLHPQQRRTLVKMGDKSEAFCRKTLLLLADNPQIVPPNLEVNEAKADLLIIDQLRPRMMRLQRLAERTHDTQAALGNDLMAFALEGYSLLKVNGKDQELEDLRRGLSARFPSSPHSTRAPSSTSL